MTVFLGTLFSSIKQIKVPYVFDGEHGIAQHAMQGNRASGQGEGEVSWFSQVAAVTCRIFLSYGGEVPS